MKTMLDNALGFHEAALRLRAHRQHVLASNISNADTPNFKARDLEFSKALREVLARDNGAPGGLSTTSSNHLAGTAKAAVGGAPLLYRATSQGSVDGNTVDMDVERNQFTDNAIRYQASLTMISGQIKNLLAAIQG